MVHFQVGDPPHSLESERLILGHLLFRLLRTARFTRSLIHYRARGKVKYLCTWSLICCPEPKCNDEAFSFFVRNFERNFERPKTLHFNLMLTTMWHVVQCFDFCSATRLCRGTLFEHELGHRIFTFQKFVYQFLSASWFWTIVNSTIRKKTFVQ